MKPPIFIYDSGDLLIFDDIKLAETYIEPIDIECYLVYDSLGQNLSLTALGHRVSIQPAIAPVSSPISLQRVFKEFLTTMGFPERTLSQASLEELVARSLSFHHETSTDYKRC